MSKVSILLIEFYQRYLSFDTGAFMIFAPGGACKYHPTCSEYTKQQIIKHGFVRGWSLGIRRIISCR